MLDITGKGHQYDARLYDPAVGRFLSADALIPDVYNPQSLNRYCYNNRLLYADPTGHAADGYDLCDDYDSSNAAADGTDINDYLGEQAVNGVLASGLRSTDSTIDRAKDHLGHHVTFSAAVKSFLVNISTGVLSQLGLSKFINTTWSVRHGPMNRGPLADDIANTFRSGTYTAKTIDKPTTVYRAISDAGNPIGRYWTRAEPKGPLQSVIDSAIDQNWGNTATRVIRADIPAGTRIFEGTAASQRGLVGGGNQVYIPKPDTKWIVP